MGALDKLETVAVGAVLLVGGYFVWTNLAKIQACLRDPLGCALGTSGDEETQEEYEARLRKETLTAAKTSQYDLEKIPETPEGNRPSNATWDLGCGVKLGIPQGYSPESWCAENPGAPICVQMKAGTVCPDAHPTDTTPTRPTVTQEQLDAAMEYTNTKAAELRAAMYPTLQVNRPIGAEYTDPLHACINGRKTVTRDEAIWPEMYARYGWDPETSDKLLFRNGCGMEGDGYGNGRFYCECG